MAGEEVTWFGEDRIETASGLIFDYGNPDPATVTLGDIAHGLSQICRFGGHTRVFQSVADHSLLTSRILQAWGLGVEYVLGGLFHDGHEAYCCDAPRPLKKWLGPEYEDLCHKADGAICDALGLEEWTFHAKEVKEADMLALVYEAKQLLPSGGWPDWEEALPYGVVVTTGKDPQLAKHDWLVAAKSLGVEEVAFARD